MMAKNKENGLARRPTSWWLGVLRERAEHMYDERLDLSEPFARTGVAFTAL